MDYSELLAALAEEIGLDGLEPDESNMVHLGAEGTALTIVYEQESRNLVVFSEVADLPLEGREAFYAEALRANWLFQGGAGATLAICPETDALALNQAWPIDGLDAETFVGALRNFLTQLWRWRKLADDWRGANEAESSGAEIPGEFLSVTGDETSLQAFQMLV